MKGGFILEREFLLKYFNRIQTYRLSMVLCGIHHIDYLLFVPEIFVIPHQVPEKGLYLVS